MGIGFWLVFFALDPTSEILVSFLEKLWIIGKVIQTQILCKKTLQFTTWSPKNCLNIAYNKLEWKDVIFVIFFLIQTLEKYLKDVSAISDVLSVMSNKISLKSRRNQMQHHCSL